MATRNEFLDHVSSDDSDHENGYDSEAAEVQKGTTRASTGHRLKRRKLSHTSEESESKHGRPSSQDTATFPQPDHDVPSTEERMKQPEENHSKIPNASHGINADSDDPNFQSRSATVRVKDVESKKKNKKDSKPGVIYLSSLPPYLKPSALRNLLQQRGFEPISRLFLTPASKAKSTSKKNSRQLYTEGWVEFASKKTARRCAETLNANIIGGRKGGFYYDDLWNMKYLRGMAWDELMAGIREERREEEGRRDEERRTIAKETQRFLEGVEEGKRVEGMKRKRQAKEHTSESTIGAGDIKRTWRQFEVKGKVTSKSKDRDKLGDDVQAVLGKIF